MKFIQKNKQDIQNNPERTKMEITIYLISESTLQPQFSRQRGIDKRLDTKVGAEQKVQKLTRTIELVNFSKGSQQIQWRKDRL